MLVTLVGHMMAPSIAFAMLGQFLTIRGIPTISLLGGGKETNYLTPTTIYQMVVPSTVVLVGMSAPEKLAQKELDAAWQAKAYGIPVGFYPDTYDVFRRPWIDRSLRDKAAFLFVPGKEEREEAQKLFPNAEIIASGNPTWEDFFAPQFSREEIRRRFEIKEDENAVLCSIGTVLETNLELLKALNAALTAEQNAQRIWKVIVGVHPGDQNYKNDPESYAKDINATVPMRFVVRARDNLSTMDTLPGMDYVVDTPGSSIGINAACLRKPVICYCSKPALDGLEQVIAKRSWRPCELGVMLPIYNLNDLADAFGQDFGPMIERQKKVYPKPAEKGRAVKMMAETLQKYGSLKKQ